MNCADLLIVVGVILSDKIQGGIMIEALLDIRDVQQKNDFLDEFAEDIGEKNRHVLKINFDINDKDNVSYSGIGYEEFSQPKKLKYLYKGVKGNGSNYTPIAKITYDIKRYFVNGDRKTVIKGWVGKYELSGSMELLKFALDVGLGSRGSQGFGMIEMAANWRNQ